MCKGISKSEFTKRFEKKIEDVFGSVIAKHIEAGLLEEDEDNIRCTEKGLDLNNSVLCDFM
jgi:oxygen-independent coproporphyrinogen-3 oxidase